MDSQYDYFNPKSVLKTANYYVQQLFGAHQGNHVLDIMDTLPDKVYASATENDDKIILKLINANSVPVTAEIKLSGVKDGYAEVTLLQNNNLEAKNSLTFTGEPVYNVTPVMTTAEVIKDNVVYE